MSSKTETGWGVGIRGVINRISGGKKKGQPEEGSGEGDGTLPPRGLFRSKKGRRPSGIGHTDGDKPRGLF